MFVACIFENKVVQNSNFVSEIYNDCHVQHDFRLWTKDGRLILSGVQEKVIFEAGPLSSLNLSKL